MCLEPSSEPRNFEIMSLVRRLRCWLKTESRGSRRARLPGAAQTSTAAVYELFGDKGGLVREVFLEGFRLLRRNLDQLESSDDPLADLVRVVAAFRLFVRDNPVLAEVMFSRPFSDFAPGPPQVAVFPPLVERARRCLHAGLLAGDEADIAHVFLALVHGLATQESNGWLGTTQTSVDRRWALAVRATLDGLRTDCVGT